jgi:glycosyltransferase involved in cell wall biosynthesis
MDWHLITAEYPPQSGGISDYSHLIATGLAAEGETVHVWCPSPAAQQTNNNGVAVHRELGQISPKALRRVGRMLDQFPVPRRLLVQWVPHGYGYQSMNLPFCFWLWRRAKFDGDQVEIMVHEPYLAFGEGSWKQNCVAVVHRLMTLVLMNAARRVWISIPAWEALCRPYALGRRLQFHWLPVASNIAVVNDPEAVEIIRKLYSPQEQKIVGHFGTYDRNVKELLLQTVPSLLSADADCLVLLLGRGSEVMREELLRVQPDLEGLVHATGMLPATDLSLHITACDVLLQPYFDGVSTRRTSVMIGLSHGRPIVTTRGRLTESLWDESDAVALVPVGDIAALVKTTEDLILDDTDRRRLSAAAKALYDERFAAERTIGALRESVV